MHVIEIAAQLIKSGEVVAFPTETFWGLAADPRNQEAIDMLIKLKVRPPDKGISLIVANSHIAGSLIALERNTERERFKRLTTTFWPGPLTLVANPSHLAREQLYQRVFAPDGSLALRVSSLAEALKLAELSGGIITATSANPSEQKPAMTSDEVRKYFTETFVCEIPLTNLEDEFTNVGLSEPSTILDIRGSSMKIIREGAISEKLLYQSLE